MTRSFDKAFKSKPQSIGASFAYSDFSATLSYAIEILDYSGKGARLKFTVFESTINYGGDIYLLLSDWGKLLL